jgi:hypothetical protein
MIRTLRSELPREAIGIHEVADGTDRHERLVTVIATSLGVIIVAAIALLMGMV